MKTHVCLALFLFLAFQTGAQEETPKKPIAANVAPPAAAGIDPRGMTILARFSAPAGYARKEAPAGTFAAYLQCLPLKPHGAVVKLFDGRVKPNSGIYVAVIDLPIGPVEAGRYGRRDLHQCADAVIRLRAEYLFAQGRYDEIRFRFTSGFLAEYSRWRRGERVTVSGNNARWEQSAPSSNSFQNFWRYLETVFAYAGTASLARELKTVSREDLDIGDVFIQPGHPGHAVIVVDAAVSKQSGRKVFLLAQSYMPAQEIQVLANPNDARLSPWYASDFGAMLRTPEWTFSAGDLERFREE
jgi:hypothetical protein